MRVKRLFQAAIKHAPTVYSIPRRMRCSPNLLHISIATIRSQPSFTLSSIFYLRLLLTDFLSTLGSVFVSNRRFCAPSAK